MFRREFHPLHELALDLRYSSSAAAGELWSRVAPDLWAQTRNPWLILRAIKQERLDLLDQDEAFETVLAQHIERRRVDLDQVGWFRECYSGGPLSCVAYFSMEFGVSEALPIYSGGLGILAGDHLKTASDLGVPLVGVGLLYQQGYFRQSIDKSGNQVETYPINNPAQLPIAPVVDSSGDAIQIELALPGRTLYLRAWQAFVGKVRLYLLDSNDLLNQPADRGLTAELYSGGEEMRIQQEMILGIGGWRLLEQLGIAPEVCHLNEGHAAFVTIERACSWAKEHSVSFEEAFAHTRQGNIFTTHTPVESGFDRFSPELFCQYFDSYEHVPGEKLLPLGQTAGDPRFNMAYLAARASSQINGVSQLHAKVSEKLFAQVDVEVKAVTNGIHVPSWESPLADRLWKRACGDRRWLGTLETIERDLSSVSDEELWAFRNQQRAQLIDYARDRYHRTCARRGCPAATTLLDKEHITLGFARRFTEYKRPTLLLGDRLEQLLNDGHWPVQLILSGKAHPQDEAGRQMIRAWIDFIESRGLEGRVLFLDDYDILVAERMVQGVDLWVNTPRRPWEASGTSGMKVLVNGGLNLSELDGWWAEAYQPQLGWGIEAPDDAAEKNLLFDLLQEEVLPAFYERDERGLPTAWLAKVRSSMSALTPQFSTNRMVRQYTEELYLPAAEAFRHVHT